MRRKAFAQYSRRLLPLTLSALAASPVIAFESEEMLCSIAGQTRTIFIEFENPPAAVPCTVKENKQAKSPQGAVTLWRAVDDQNFCRKSLVGYVNKLRGLGFKCEPADGSVVIESTDNAD